jgi:hypothetical protein
MSFYGFFHLPQILIGNNTNSFEQALLAHRGQLVSHRFTHLPAYTHVRLARIEVVCLAGEWNNLNAIEEFIGGIVADDDGGTFLANFPSTASFNWQRRKKYHN